MEGEMQLAKPDVKTVLLEKTQTGRWNLLEPVVHRQPGQTLIIECPKPEDLGNANWEVWFDPVFGPHHPDRNNQVVLRIRRDIPYVDTEEDVEKVHYKYTILIGAEVLDPKIIIDPPS
jgi:hypothetical protein